MSIVNNLPFNAMSHRNFVATLSDNTKLILNLYSHLTFQPSEAGDGLNNSYNRNTHIPTYTDTFSCKYYSTDETFNFLKSERFLTIQHQMAPMHTERSIPY